MSLFGQIGQLVTLQRQRNCELERISTALEELVVEVQVGALALSGIEASLTEAGGVQAGLRIGPMVQDPADQGGDAMQDLVLVIPDNKMVLVELAFPLKDQGGNEIKGPDDQPWPAEGWTVATDDAAIVGITPNDGSEPDFPPAGTGFWLRGRALGQTGCEVSIPLPDGTVATVNILANVTASALGAATVVAGEPVEDPHPAE